MTARTGMANIISTFRGMTNAGTADYTGGTATYWTDDQLQDVLDKHRSDFYHREMQSVGEYSTAGAVVTTRYYLGSFNVESGTAVFYIQNAEGTTLTETTDYTIDYSLGLVTFVSNTSGLDYFATYRSYDLNRAAAEVWRMKAAHYASFFNFSTHGHSIHKGELRKYALEMADYYTQAGGARGVDLDRSDTC